MKPLFGRIRAALAGLFLLVQASPAAAHGFGQRFDLPLPLWLWVWSAGGTIVFTFAVMAIFVRDRAGGTDYPRLSLLTLTPLPSLGQPLIVWLLRAIVAFVFLLTIAAGLYGNQDPYHNLVPTMIWVIWWVGFAFTCALIGNLWALTNPFRSIYAVAETLYAVLTGGRSLSRGVAYPAGLGTWPAVLFFLGFAWAELIWPSKDVPSLLAHVMVTYSAIMWAGMFLFDADTWLERGDAFSVIFGVLGRFAPLEGRVRAGRCELNLRPLAAGLLDDKLVSWSFLVFVLCMLSTVTFDGFLETPLFQSMVNWIYGNPSFATFFYRVSEYGIDDTALTKTVALIAFPLIFVGAFTLCSWLMVVSVAHGRLGTSEVARSFVLTLVPIAVAYHLAHYLSLLLTAGQFIIPLVSDPFGYGWNLFGTVKYQVNIGLVSPKFFWYSSVTAIVIGHILAVYLAHVVALRVFGDRRAALISQLPMVALMVGYTMVSLWILAQPVVG